jgi:hypothetical protein
MCNDCIRLQQVLVRAFGHLQNSDDPHARRAAVEVRETLRRQSASPRQGVVKVVAQK